MKNILIKITLILFSIFIGCSDDASSNDSNPIGIGGNGGVGGNGNVTFTIGNTTKQEDGDGNGTVDEILYFTASPSVSVKITKVTFSLPAQQYTNSITDDGTIEYPANTPVEVIGFFKNEIATGQQWTFQFEGTLASNNQAFIVTSNYTIP